MKAELVNYSAKTLFFILKSLYIIPKKKKKVSKLLLLLEVFHLFMLLQAVETQIWLGFFVS